MPLTTNQEFVSLLMSRLGRRTAQGIRPTLVDEINIARIQAEANPFIPFFLFTVVPVGIPAGVGSVNLPTGFILEQEDSEPYLTAVTGGIESRIFKRSLEDLNYRELNATQTGTPTRYSISHGKIWLSPTSDQAYTLNFPCALQTAAIEDNASTLNPWFTYAPNYILGLAGAAFAGTHMQNANLEKRMLDMASGALRTLINYHEARENTNMDYSSSDLIADVPARVP